MLECKSLERINTDLSEKLLLAALPVAPPEPAAGTAAGSGPGSTSVPGAEEEEEEDGAEDKILAAAARAVRRKHALFRDLADKLLGPVAVTEHVELARGGVSFGTASEGSVHIKPAPFLGLAMLSMLNELDLSNITGLSLMDFTVPLALYMHVLRQHLGAPGDNARPRAPRQLRQLRFGSGMRSATEEAQLLALLGHRALAGVDGLCVTFLESFSPEASSW